jgi:hypothetical protein
MDADLADWLQEAYNYRTQKDHADAAE